MLIKPKRSNSFDERFLKTLIKQQDSGVTVRKTCQHLLLHPIHLNNLENSLKEVLRQGVARYNKDLKGILLGFKDVKLLNSLGVINNDSCGIHIDVSANFFVFEPEVNAELQGIVIRKSKDHIGVLVYKSFNVSIPKQYEDEEWLGSSVNLGDEVKLSITYTDFNHHLPYIRGILLSIVARNPNVDVKTKAVKTKSVNKKIKFDDEGEAIGQNVSHIDEVIESVIQGSNSDKNINLEEGEASKKKSKRKNKKDESGDVDLTNSLLAQVKDEVLEKPKKKKKKQGTVNDAKPVTNNSQMDVIESVAKGSNLEKEVGMEDGEASENNSKKKDESRNVELINSLLVQVNGEVSEKLKKKEKKRKTVNEAEPVTFDDTETERVNRKIQLVDNDETLDQNNSQIDVIESVAKGSNLEKEADMEDGEASENNSKKKDGSGNVELINSLLVQVKGEVSEKLKKKEKKRKTVNEAEPVTYEDTKTKKVNKKMLLSDDSKTKDQIISHIDDVIDSVSKGSNSEKEVNIEEGEASEKKSKGEKRKRDESVNLELIDSLLAQVKDEVSNKPKKKKLDTLSDAELVIYDDSQVMEEPKE